MEEQVALESEYSDKKILLTTNQFIFLSLVTFGLYPIWWTYKSWKIFQARDSYDISPAWRTVFSIIFLYGLFERIKSFAQRTGYEKDYVSGLLFFGVIVFNLLANLPDPYFLVGLGVVLCFIPPFQALNYAIENSRDYEVDQQIGFNSRQTVLIVIGSILWFGVLLALFIS